jgi:cation:H+ antiporter
MVLLVLFSLAGLALLALAADQLIVGSARLAERLGIAPVLVGVIVIGFGTSAPELVVAATAGARHETTLAAASLVGSNIINLTLILGVAGLVAPLMVRSSILRREAPLSLAAMTAFALALLYGLDTAAGIVLGLGLGASAVLLVRFTRSTPRDPLAREVADFLAPAADAIRHPLPRETARTFLGLAGTLLGAQLLVANASEMSVRVGVPADVVGFTLVALGTSLPELVTSIQAQRHGDGDLLIGNLLGSNLVNSLAGGALIAFTTTRPASGITPAIITTMVGVSAVTWALLARGQRLTRPESFLLLGAYAAALPLLV